MSEIVKHETLVEALAAAKLEFGVVERNCHASYQTKRGDLVEYDYADLGEINAKTTPALSKHGLVLTRHTVFHDSQWFTKAVLHHASGTLENEVPIYFESYMQSLGSAITYGGRYAESELLNIAADSDDDGKGAGMEPQGREGKQQQGRGKATGRANGQQEKEPTTEKPQVFSLNAFKKRIDQTPSPSDFIALIDKFGGLDQLRTDANMAQNVFDYAADKLRSHKGSDGWADEDCESAVRHLLHVHNSLSLEQDYQAGEEQQQVNETPKQAPTFEVIAGQIDNIIKPAALCDYLTRAESSAVLLADVPLLKRVIEKAGSVAYARLQASKWKTADVDAVEEIIARIKLKIDAQKPPTSVTQGELINE